MQTLLISVDLNAHRFTYSMLAGILSQLGQNYEIKDTFLFNFNDRKHSAFRALNVTPVHANPSRKRVQMDIAQALHTLEYVLLNRIDAAYIFCGALESEQLFKSLKKHGTKVIAGVLEERKSAADEQLTLQRTETCENEPEPPEPSDSDADLFENVPESFPSSIPAVSSNDERGAAPDAAGQEFLPHAGGRSVDTPQMIAAKEKLEKMLKLLNTNKSDILRAEYERIINK